LQGFQIWGELDGVGEEYRHLIMRDFPGVCHVLPDGFRG
jgi:hypothetical protein